MSMFGYQTESLLVVPSVRVTVVVVVGVVAVLVLMDVVLTVEVNAEKWVALAITLIVVQVVLGMDAKENQEHPCK